jgi:hypothetical protein
MSAPILPLFSHRSLGKANWSVAMANKKALRAVQRAQEASATVEDTRKRMFDEMTSTGAQYEAAPVRTSTKAFAATDPRHALAVLSHVNFEKDLQATNFSELQLIAYKYNVRDLSKRLTGAVDDGDATKPPLYKSPPAAAMMATKTVRYVYDIACEMAASSPEEHTDALRALQWHSPQAMLKGRETRGTGVVAYLEEAVSLLKAALVLATKRVQARVEAADKYEHEMHATEIVASGVAEA